MTYVGTMVPVPLAIDGLYGTRKIPITGLLVGRNLVLENNMLEKEGGATNQNAAALSSDIIAEFDWWPDSATQRFIAVTDDGAVYRDTGSWTFPTTVLPIGTLTIATRPPHLVEGGNEVPGNPKKLFLFTGNNEVRVGSGDFTTMPVIDAAKKPADWTGTRQPTCGVIHQGRLWAFLEHTAYYSSPTDHEDFRSASGGGTIPISPGEGERIVHARSFRKMLAVFKYPRGIYLIDTSSATVTNWRYDTQSRAVGTTGPWSAIDVPNDVLFVDSEINFHLLSATSVERDAASSNISTPKLGQLIREQFSALRGPWVQMQWYGDKQQVHVVLSALGAAVNNRRIIVDFNRLAVGPRFTYSDRDVVQSIVMRRMDGIERPYIGDDAGIVLRLDQGARNKNGSSYNGIFQLDHMDLSEIDPGFANRKKRFDWLEFEFEPVGNYNLSVNIYIDGVLKTTTPLLFSMGGAGVPLGTFLLGTDRLGAVSMTRRRRRLLWTGTRISIEGFNNGTDETFRVNKAFLGVRLAE